MSGTTLITFRQMLIKLVRMQAEEEIHRLDVLKVSRMKELLIKKQSELNDVYTNAHMEPDSDASYQNIMAIIDSGL